MLNKLKLIFYMYQHAKETDLVIT
ncbi:Protein of unknown function [Bacillus cereus]|nr:Protein of unknown function [Bacillus cereus]